MKKIILCFILGALLLVTVTVVALDNNPYRITINNQDIPIEGYNIDGKTYVPIRDISEYLNVELSFNNDTINLNNNKHKIPFSEWLQIFGIITTFIISVVSIIIAILTLRQNNKMIEESTRPSVVVYIDTVHYKTPLRFIVVKNFGASPAIINTFECITSDKCTLDASFLNQFANLKGTILAPHQSKIHGINIDDQDEEDKLVFKIRYSSSTSTYKDEFEIIYSNYMHDIDWEPKYKSPSEDICHLLLSLVKRDI